MFYSFLNSSPGVNRSNWREKLSAITLQNRKGKVKKMRKITKIRRQIKAISPVISVLLMIAVAVVASLVVYAWVMGFIGGKTNQVGQSVQIQSMGIASNGHFQVYLQNVGQGAITLDPAGSVYINGTQYTSTITPTGPLNPGQTATLDVPSASVAPGDNVIVKVVSGSGTYSQVTGSPGQSFASPTASPTAPPTQYTVSFGTSGGGSGSTTSPTGSQTYNAGQQVTITATPGNGYTFSAWSAVPSGAVTFGNANSASTTATINGAGTITATFTVVAPVLDHFAFDTISGTKTAGTAFSVTIRAIDQNGNAFTSYTGTNTLTASSGTISPTSTGAFTSGVWTGSVTLYTTGTITIGTTGNSKTGTSNTITVNAGTGNFGYQTIGTSSYPMNNLILGSVYTMGSQSGTANSIVAYISTNGHTRNLKAAIYTASGTLVGSTDPQSVSNNGAWVTFTFSGTKPSLTAGTQYALVLWSDNSVDFYRLSTSSYTVVYRFINYGNWPSPGGFTTDTNEYSIYCTYSIP